MCLCMRRHLPLVIGYVFDLRTKRRLAPFVLCVSMALSVYSTHSIVLRTTCTSYFRPSGVRLWCSFELVSLLKSHYYTQPASQQILSPSPCFTQIQECQCVWGQSFIALYSLYSAHCKTISGRKLRLPRNVEPDFHYRHMANPWGQGH
jgi:hypothetical protein